MRILSTSLLILLASVLGGTAAYAAWHDGEIAPATDGRTTVPGEVLTP